MWEALTPRECKRRSEWCRATPLARDRGYPRLTERPATSRNAAKLARRQVHRKRNRAEWLSGPSSGDCRCWPWSRHPVKRQSAARHVIHGKCARPWAKAAPAFTGLECAIFLIQMRTPQPPTRAWTIFIIRRGRLLAASKRAWTVLLRVAPHQRCATGAAQVVAPLGRP